MQPVHVADLPRKSEPRWRRISEPGELIEPEEDEPKEMNPHIPGNIKRPVNINAQINLRCAAGLWAGSISDLGEFALCCGRRCGVREKFNERRLNSTIVWELSSASECRLRILSGRQDMRDLMNGFAVLARMQAASDVLAAALPECA